VCFEDGRFFRAYHFTTYYIKISSKSVKFYNNFKWKKSIFFNFQPSRPLLHMVLPQDAISHYHNYVLDPMMCEKSNSIGGIGVWLSRTSRNLTSLVVSESCLGWTQCLLSFKNLDSIEFDFTLLNFISLLRHCLVG